MTSTVQTPVPDAAIARAHPLEPLSAAEIETAAKSVTAAANLNPSARFVYISLYEPAKAEVVAFEAGGPVPERLVKVIVRERAERGAHRGLAGDAGAPDRLPAPPVRILRGQPRPGQPSPCMPAQAHCHH